MANVYQSLASSLNISALSPMKRLGTPIAWLLAGGLLLMAVIVVGTALAIEKFRDDALADGQRKLESSVLLLVRHFDRQFDDFMALQSTIVADLEDFAIDSPEKFRGEMGTLAIHEAIRNKAAAWSDIAGANLYAADGTLINSSQRWPVSNLSISDRAYFKKLRTDQSLLEEVEVVQSRFSDGKAIVFARKISGPHGEFLGVITRAVLPDLIETFFSSAGLGSGASISMHHRDGQLLARYPQVPALIGENFKKGSPRQLAVFERASLSTRLASPVDGKDRLIASRTLSRLPLLIVATMTVDSALAAWRAQTKVFLLAASLSILLIAATLYLSFHKVMRQLTVEKQRLDTAVNNMTQGLLLFDRAERLIVCNRRYIDMYGLSPDIVKPGCSFRDLLRHRKQTGSFAGDVDAYCDDVLAKISASSCMVVETSDGRLVEVRNVPIPSGGWLATHEDVTDRIRAEEKIAHLAHYDALTDLPNRVMMQTHLERRLAELALGRSFALLYIDIDEFKYVNDTLGHEAGDELLRQVALRLRSAVEPKDLVARLGGDEFAIIKTDLSEQHALQALAENLLAKLRVPIDCKGQKIPIEASIGIAIAPDHGSRSHDLLKSADLAMYAAKADGRRTYRFFTPELDARLKKRRQLELDLRQAVANGELEVHYQPLVDLSSDEVNGCEALLRWRHPEHGMISPAEFIPVAEEAGLINEIGEWVLDRACAEAANWPAHIRVAVNVSPVQFRSKTLPLRVAAALRAHGLSPHRLEIEVTEAVLIRDDQETLIILEQLRALGVRLALDDFGTGYSSLSYLRRFPFDKIKIDRSFIKDLDEAGASTIVEAVVKMASACHMMTTAEGVETMTQRNMLRALGCSQMQGYLFSPPISAAELHRLLKASSSENEASRTVMTA